MPRQHVCGLQRKHHFVILKFWGTSHECRDLRLLPSLNVLVPDCRFDADHPLLIEYIIYRHCDAVFVMPLCQLEDHGVEKVHIRLLKHEGSNRLKNCAVLGSTDPRSYCPRVVTRSDLGKLSDFCISFLSFPAREFSLQMSRLPHVEIFDTRVCRKARFPSHAEVSPGRIFLYRSEEREGFTSLVAARIVKVRFEHDHHLCISDGLAISTHQRIERLLTFGHHCVLLQSRSTQPLDCSTAQRNQWRRAQN